MTLMLLFLLLLLFFAAAVVVDCVNVAVFFFPDNHQDPLICNY